MDINQNLPGNPTAPVAPVAPSVPVVSTPPVAVQQAVPQAPVAPQAPVVPSYQPVQQPTNGRTAEQFEKLLETNRLLNQELIRRSQANQTFQPIQQVQQPAPQVVEPNIADFTRVDPISGEEYIDKAKLQNALTRTQQDAIKSQEMASRAEQAMRSYVDSANQREIERQNKETFSIFPELNPQGQQFDQRFHAQVRGILTDSFLNTREYGGRPLTFIEAANYVKGTPGQVATPVAPLPVATPAQPAAQQSTAQQLKEQASAFVPSQPQSVLPSSQSDAEIRALSQRTRLGDDAALAERLKFTEHILPKEAE